MEMKEIIDPLQGRIPLCPKCNKPLFHAKVFNEGNPHVGWVCINEKCKGWFCDCCEEWHPYGTSCSVAMVRNTRDETHYCEQDPKLETQRIEV